MTTPFLRPDFFAVRAPLSKAAGALATRGVSLSADASRAAPSVVLPRASDASPAVRQGATSSASGATHRLDAHPLFVDGSTYDEFSLSGANLEFARAQFGLDDAFVALARTGEARCSVVYHSENGRVTVDAYRAAAPALKGSVFSAYVVKNPDFDPGKAYKNERVTKLSEGHFLGTIIPSRQLVVPDGADRTLLDYLASNGFQPREHLPFDDFGRSAEFKRLFGIPDHLGVQMYEMQKKSFSEKFKVFYQLCKESPEYAMLKLGDVLDNVGSAMLLGVITPELWKQGTAYGIASTISSIGNIGSPAVGIAAESVLGSVVDNAVNSDRPLSSLKKINLVAASAYAVKIGCMVGMHPAVIQMMGSHPGLVFTGLYAGSTVIGSVVGVVSGKAEMAIHDQLINKSQTLASADYSKSYYQILGVEASLARILYLGSYSAAVAAVAAFPAASLPLAVAGGALWAGSGFIWPLYREKPEVKTIIEGTGYVHDGDRYVFDSGWEATFEGGKGRLVQEDANHFSVSMNDGELRLKSDVAQNVDVSHRRRLIDWLPSFLKFKSIGEKEHWDLDNGAHRVQVSRYGEGFRVEAGASGEFVVRRPH
ncbi:MAG: hypothetical protein EB084_20695 [Proteobacteria bacterium]|nr:hypothetical protein [Pseudomonadota bacterium]